MATQADLVRRVLQNIHILIAGDPVNSEHDTIIDECIAQVQAELIEYGLAYWALSAIPESVMRGLIIMVSADAASSFMEKSAAREFEADKKRGERMIRRVASGQSKASISHIYF